MTPEQLKVLKLTAELLLSQYPRSMVGSKANELRVALSDLDNEQDRSGINFQQKDG